MIDEKKVIKKTVKKAADAPRTDSDKSIKGTIKCVSMGNALIKDKKNGDLYIQSGKILMLNEKTLNAAAPAVVKFDAKNREHVAIERGNGDALSHKSLER